MSITPDKAPESLIASDPNALFLQRTDEINDLLSSGASLSGHERNCFFLNTGGGQFATASATSGFDFYDDARAVAKVDWDHDGDIDLWFANRTAPRVRFLKNEGSRGTHFLMIRLRGTTSNRDAIGARVEVKSKERILVRGLRAGEGFLGQSSKWIHFGLGQIPRVDSVTVYWPGGKSEVFTGIKPDARFVLIQGAGMAKEWIPPARAISLPGKKYDLPVPSSVAQVRLCDRMTIPRLECQGEDGSPETIAPREGRPLLICIWASWCPACDQEFKEWAAYANELEKAGVDIWAISVNGLGQGDDTTFADADAYLAKLGMKVKHRRANGALLEQLRLLANQAVVQYDPLPLPSGFLIDAEGKLAAFYRGPVPAKKILTDIKALGNKEAHEIFASALPYAGKWIGAPRKYQMDKLVIQMIDAGMNEAAFELAQQHQDTFSSKQVYAAILSRLGNQHAAKGDLEAAVHSYREALKHDPESAICHFNLAVSLERQKKIPLALVEYERAIALDANITVAHLNRGAILARGSAEQLKAGIISLQKAVELNPHLAVSHYHLGMALDRAQQYRKALKHYRRAALLAPDHFGNAMQLAHLLERAGRYNEALDAYRKIHHIHPQKETPLLQSAIVYEKLKQPQKAVEKYRACLALNPDNVPALNNLAWLLATSSDVLVRKPEEAVKRATRAAKMTRYQQASILDTLASAQYAVGDDKAAIETLAKAITIARRRGEQTFVDDLEKKLRTFRSSR